MLEAAIQEGDLGEGGYEAWLLLGDARSMDEREESAMKALLEGTRLAKAAGAPTEGLIVGFGACYVARAKPLPVTSHFLYK